MKKARRTKRGRPLGPERTTSSRKGLDQFINRGVGERPQRCRSIASPYALHRRYGRASKPGRRAGKSNPNGRSHGRSMNSGGKRQLRIAGYHIRYDILGHPRRNAGRRVVHPELGIEGDFASSNRADEWDSGRVVERPGRGFGFAQTVRASANFV